MDLYFCEKPLCGNIQIYLLEGDRDKIREYRMSKMSALPQQIGACCFITNDPIRMMKMKEQKHLPAELILKRQEMISMPSRFGKIESYGENQFLFGSVSYRSLIEMYCNGGYDTEANLLHLEYLKHLSDKYLLFHQNYEAKEVPVNSLSKKTQTVYQIDGILSLPKPLYLLERILRGDAHEVIDDDLTEQLSLFTYHKVPIKTYQGWDIEDMQKHFSNTQIITEEKLKNDAKVLKKIRSIKGEE